MTDENTPDSVVADSVEASVEFLAWRSSGLSGLDWNRVSNVFLDAAKRLRATALASQPCDDVRELLLAVRDVLHGAPHVRTYRKDLIARIDATLSDTPNGKGANMNNETLKPCPFCEADAYFEGGVEERDDRRYFSMTVCCGSCEATITETINFTEYRKLGERGAYQRLMEMCSAAWNSRAEPEPASLSQPHDDVRELLKEAATALGDACLSVHDELLDRIDTALSQTDDQPTLRQPAPDNARLLRALEPFAAMGRVLEARSRITFGKVLNDNKVVCESSGEVGMGVLTMGHFRDAAALLPDAPGWGGMYRQPFPRQALASTDSNGGE